MLSRVLELLKTRSFSRLDNTAQTHKLSARIMLTAEKQVPGLSDLVQVIKVSQCMTASLERLMSVC